MWIAEKKGPTIVEVNRWSEFKIIANEWLESQYLSRYNNEVIIDKKIRLKMVNPDFNWIAKIEEGTAVKETKRDGW